MNQKKLFSGNPNELLIKINLYENSILKIKTSLYKNHNGNLIRDNVF